MPAKSDFGTSSLNIPENSQYRILLVDDHDLVRAGIRMLIKEFDKSSIILEASSGEESIEIARDSEIDFVFMDLLLPGIDGVTAAVQLMQAHPELKIVMLTGASDRPFPQTLKKAGVSGFMTKSSAIAEIRDAIDSANKGEFYMSRDIIDAGGADPQKGVEQEANPFDRLSQRESQVVSLLLQGFKTSDAGDSLVLNAKTISTYKRRAFEKLDVENTAELVKLAIAHGIMGVG